METIFNKIKNLPQGLRMKIYNYDSTYRQYFKTNIVIPFNVERNHTEIMTELTNVMQFYWIDLDRYCTMRNFVGNIVNADYPVPSLVPAIMNGQRVGPPLRTQEEVEEGEITLLRLILAELADGFIY